MEDQAMDTAMDTSTATPPPSALPSYPPADPILEPSTNEKQPAASPSAPSVPTHTRTEEASPPVRDMYIKRLLPESLFSPFSHGLITGEPRTPEQQAAFEARKSEILSTMTAEEIEEKYQDTAKKVNHVLQEIKDGDEKVDKDIENAKKTREMERRAWLGMKKAAAEGDI